MKKALAKTAQEEAVTVYFEQNRLSRRRAF